MAEEKEDFSNAIKLLKKRYVWIILAVILILGFSLRAYHMNYPVVGYHNWKEEHYLGEARDYAKNGFFKSGFFTPRYDYPNPNADPAGAHPDTFPTTSIIVGFFFKIFGMNLGLARFINILFMLGAVFFTYLFVKKLFKREDIALIATFLMALNPLFIFFGRQMQLINAALFFMMAGGYYYLRWREDEKPRNLVLTSIFLTISIITKYDFLLIAIPILLTFPYKRLLKWRKHVKHYATAILFPITIPLWILYMNTVKGTYVVKEALAGETIQLGTFFTGRFWSTMKMFAADNYTLMGVLFALIGLVAIAAMYKKNFANRFIFYYFIGGIVWAIIFSYKLLGHNYHQYPIAPLIIILQAYALIFIGTNIQKLIKIKHSRWIVMIIMFLLLIFQPFTGGGIFKAKNRMFDVQFLGLDIAGEYVKTHSAPTDIVLFPSHQSYGFLWHSDRKGYTYAGRKLDNLKQKEQLGANWIFLYQWGLADVMQHEDTWNYIKQNYELKQIAFQDKQTIYLLMKRGGSFDETKLNELIQNKPVNSKEYEYTRGKAVITYIDLE